MCRLAYMLPELVILVRANMNAAAPVQEAKNTALTLPFLVKLDQKWLPIRKSRRGLQ